MSALMAENSASAIWQRTIQPQKRDLEPEVARALLNLRFSRADLDRADELAEKARTGELSAEEERELEDYRDVEAAIEFLKSKARV